MATAPALESAHGSLVFCSIECRAAYLLTEAGDLPLRVCFVRREAGCCARCGAALGEGGGDHVPGAR